MLSKHWKTFYKYLINYTEKESKEILQTWFMTKQWHLLAMFMTAGQAVLFLFKFTVKNWRSFISVKFNAVFFFFIITKFGLLGTQSYLLGMNLSEPFR